MVLTACSAPTPPSAAVVAAPQAGAGPAAPVFSIDIQRTVEAIADRPNMLWQDTVSSTSLIRERRKSNRYRLKTIVAPNTWPAPAALPAASNNGVAYTHGDTSFGTQTPSAGERVIAVCSDANGTVVRLDAAANGAIIAPNFQALNGLAGAGTITKSAVSMSGNNFRIYLLSSGGYFVVLDAFTGVRLAAVKVSQSGFANIAPFIDYSNSGGMQYSDELVYALAADGSLYRLRVNSQTTTVTVTGWRATGGIDAVALGIGYGATSGTWTMSNGGITSPLNYGAAVVIKAAPIVWNGNAIFGASNGNFYRVRTAASALDTVRLSTFPIETSPAADFNASFTDFSDVFIPAGDRLHWVDATNPTSLSRKAISPALTLDHGPVSAANGASGMLNNFAYTSGTTTSAYNATDWVSATTAVPAAEQGPTQFGGGRTILKEVDLGANLSGLARNPVNGKLWVTTPSNNKVSEVDPVTGAVTAGYDGNGNYGALVQTIPVGGSAASTPAGICRDPERGGVWVTCFGTNSIEYINSSGTVIVGDRVNAIPSPTAICYDDSATPGNPADDVLWVCSTTSAAGKPTGALYKVTVPNPHVLTAYTNADTVNTPGVGLQNYDTFTAPNPKITTLTSTQWGLYGPQGVALDGNRRVWVGNTSEFTDLTVYNTAGPLPEPPASYPFFVNGNRGTTGAGRAGWGLGTATGPYTAVGGGGAPNAPSAGGQAAGSVVIFDPPTGKFVSRLVTTGCPYGIVRCSNTRDSMWVGTYRWGSDRAERYDTVPGATYLKKIGGTTQTTNHWQPCWLAMDLANNQLWIANGNALQTNSLTANIATTGLDRIRADTTVTNLSVTGAPNANYFGTYATGAQPRGTSVDSTGNVWVANSAAKTCTKYSSVGAALGTYPVGSQPYAVACDTLAGPNQDCTYVTNRADGTVSRITAATQPPAPLSGPSGVTIDSLGNVWVANSGDNSLTVLDQSGNSYYPKITTGVPVSPAGLATAGTNVWATSSTAASAAFYSAISAPPPPPPPTTMTPPAATFGVGANAAGVGFISIPSTARLATYSAAGVAGAVLTTGLSPRGVAVDQTNSDVWVANSGASTLSYFAGGAGVKTDYTVGLNPWGCAVFNQQVWSANTAANSATRLSSKAGVGRTGIGTGLGTVAYTNAGSPRNMLIDPQENVWIANTTTTKLSKLWFAGQQDLMAADSYLGADGNDSYAYMRFRIASGNFAGKTPVNVRLSLTASSAAARTVETYNAWATSQAVAGAIQWSGFNTTPTPNVDWNNSPALGAAVGAFIQPMPTGANVQIPITNTSDIFDYTNTAYDATNGLTSYAVQSQGTNLADVAHINTIGPTLPRLLVDLSNTRLPVGAGLRSMPTIDSFTKRVWVMGTNAVFELKWDTAANFSDRSQVAYSYSKSGVDVGPQLAGTYTVPTGASILTIEGRLLTVDYDGTATSQLNCYNLPSLVGGYYLDTTAPGNNTTQLVSTAPVSGQVSSSQITYDYDFGSVYVASGATVVGFKLLQ